MDSPEKGVSKQVHALLYPINISFLLPLVGGELEERLKYLSKLIKVGLENINLHRASGMFHVWVMLAMLHWCWRTSDVFVD